jgi:hypothetical protein
LELFRNLPTFLWLCHAAVATPVGIENSLEYSNDLFRKPFDQRISSGDGAREGVKPPSCLRISLLFFMTLKGFNKAKKFRKTSACKYVCKKKFPVSRYPWKLQTGVSGIITQDASSLPNL